MKYFLRLLHCSQLGAMLPPKGYPAMSCFIFYWVRKKAYWHLVGSNRAADKTLPLPTMAPTTKKCPTKV